jgi:hypothetical protein
MKEWLFGLALSLAALVVGLVIFEIGGHLFLQPCMGCYGQLFGRALPPILVLTEGAVPPADPRTVWQNKNNGNKGNSNPLQLTLGDLFGIKREDPYLGYTAMEASNSVNGWWVSNNIGARSNVPTLPKVARGNKRLFVFGESYGQASRVAQDKTWFALLQADEPHSEIVNMAVDGYSMGQSYLRYLTVRDKFEWNSVMFIFVPESDLWRDINTERFLAEGWGAYTILPRLILDGDGIKLVPGPYPIGSDIYVHDVPTVTPRVLDHLRSYDRFYFPLLYESPRFLGDLISYKLIAKTLGWAKLMRVYNDAKMNLHSEAMEIVRRIFKAVNSDTIKTQKTFILSLLPDPVLLSQIRADRNSPAHALWNERVQLFIQDGLHVVDLMPDLLDLPESKVDRGYDQSHYGPKTNRALAHLFKEKLEAFRIFQIDSEQ